MAWLLAWRLWQQRERCALAPKICCSNPCHCEERHSRYHETDRTPSVASQWGHCQSAACKPACRFCLATAAVAVVIIIFAHTKVEFVAIRVVLEESLDQHCLAASSIQSVPAAVLPQQCNWRHHEFLLKRVILLVIVNAALLRLIRRL